MLLSVWSPLTTTRWSSSSLTEGGYIPTVLTADSRRLPLVVAGFLNRGGGSEPRGVWVEVYVWVKCVLDGEVLCVAGSNREGKGYRGIRCLWFICVWVIVCEDGYRFYTHSCGYFFFFFERPTNSPNGLLAKFTTSGYTRLPNGGKPSPRAEAREHSPEGTTVR
ncbi:hypothetical protein Hanom_Chr13g01205631 [Helianthus anomalus]